MTLEQLRIFVAIAEREHVTATAAALNLTQSAVSNALAALEERHAVRLFDRVGRGIVLNGNGRAFVDEARAVLTRAGQAEAVLADLSGLRRGRLAIRASQTIANYWLPGRLGWFRAAYPAVTLDVELGNTDDVTRSVLEGRCELGFVEGEVRHDLLEQTVVGEDRLVLVVPPDHPWAGVEAVDSDRLRDAAWIVRETGSGTRSSLEAALRDNGHDPAALDVRMVLPANEAVLSAVQAGEGVAVLSAHVVAATLAAGLVVAPACDLPVRSFRMLRHRERYRTRAAEVFAAELTTGERPDQLSSSMSQ